MASKARVARWAAERATWQLRNRGDTHFAADRRLYKKQLTELRRDWLSQDLLQRRMAYVAERDQRIRKEGSRAWLAARKARHLASDEVVRARDGTGT